MSEYHVASFIVRCHGQDLNSTLRRISDVEGAEVHHYDDSGKIIMTAEGNRHKDISIIIDIIRDYTEVVDVAAVYHEYTNEFDTDEIQNTTINITQAPFLDTENIL